MIPLTPRLLRAALSLLIHSEYIGVVHAPDMRPLRLAGTGARTGTVTLCLWATHNIIATPGLQDVLLPPDTARRLAHVADSQTVLRGG